MDKQPESAQFDEFAEDYEIALERGIAVSGERKDYFAEKRVVWLKGILGATPTAKVLDFGCGTGSATPFLLDILGAETLIGVDISEHSLQVARKAHPEKTSFSTLENYVPDGTVDLAFCNGVFHHIPLADRSGAVEYVLRALRPGGIFAFWENNPWNLGTQYVMWKIPFDRDAIKIPPPGAISLLKAGGFRVERLNFQFVFPKSLSFLRGLEKPLASLPLGAQYQVLCRKV